LIQEQVLSEVKLCLRNYVDGCTDNLLLVQLKQAYGEQKISKQLYALPMLSIQ